MLKKIIEMDLIIKTGGAKNSKKKKLRFLIKICHIKLMELNNLLIDYNFFNKGDLN